MAISTGFLESASVTLEKDSSTITLTGGVDCSYVSSGTAVFIDGSKYLLEGFSGSAADDAGTSTLTLREEWKGETLTNVSLTAFNTIEGLRDAIRQARAVVEGSKGKVDNTQLSNFLSTTEELVQIDLDGATVNTTSYSWAISQLRELLDSRTFEDLSNTPNSLVGSKGKILIVSEDETKLEFATPNFGDGGSGTIVGSSTDLEDMPKSLVGGAGKKLQVKADESGYEISDSLGSDSITYGQIPSGYVSGPIRLIVDGEELDTVFQNVDSYVPKAGDSVVAIGEVIVGVIASGDPLMENICMFYGYPNAINSYWDVELSANFYAQFNGVVFGDLMGEPTHQANADTIAIITRAKEINPTIKVFGYVPIGLDPAWQDSSLTIEEIRSRITNWKNSGATHIFLDEYGFDYYVTRQRQNDCILHSRSLGMPVIANSWSTQYCFSNEDMVIDWLDGFRPNPDQTPCILDEEDYVLFENVLYKFHHEAGSDSYKDPEQYVNNNQRIIDMYEYMYAGQPEYDGRSYYDVYKTKGFALDSIINPDQKMYSESYLAALACGMGAHCASVAFWGASVSTYPTYDVPEIRASSRIALGVPTVEVFGGQYVGRLTTKIGPDTIEVTWVQEQQEILYDETSLATGLEPKKNIRTIQIPTNLEFTGQAGFFTATFGSDRDDTRNLSFAITGTETRAELIDMIVNFEYSSEFLKIYEVTRQGDTIFYTSVEPYTEELSNWWVWHTDGIFNQTISMIAEAQKGTDGKSLEYREVRINGEAIDYGFGPYWRKPRKVANGYVYFDTTNNRNITYRDGKWYDLNGNLADSFVEAGGVPYGAIIQIQEGVEIPKGWMLADGQDGRPLIETDPHPTIIKVRDTIVEEPPAKVGEITFEYYFNDPNSYARINVISDTPIDTSTTALIDDGGAPYQSYQVSNAGSIGGEQSYQILMEFIIGGSQSLARLDEPFTITFVLEDGTTITRSSENGTEIFN